MTGVDGAGRRWRIGLLLVSCLTLTGFTAACTGGQPSSAPFPAGTVTSTAVAGATPSPTETASGGSASSTRSAAEPSAPPTTPLPGSVNETVAAGKQQTAKPVKLETGRSRFDDSLSVSISRLRTANVKAELPGEVPGPSVIFDVEIVNRSSRGVDLNQLVVTVLDDKQVPASRITTKPARAMPHAVGGGSTARGRYVYVVPKGTRDPITVQVSLRAEQPVLTFRGRVR